MNKEEFLQPEKECKISFFS